MKIFDKKEKSMSDGFLNYLEILLSQHHAMTEYVTDYEVGFYTAVERIRDRYKCFVSGNEKSDLKEVSKN